MHPDRLLTASLRAAPRGVALAQIMAAALDAVAPDQAVRRFLRRDGDWLHVADQIYDLRSITRVFVVGAGKAGAPMATATAALLGDRLSGGIVIVKEGHSLSTSKPSNLQSPISNLQLVEASHPLPDQRGVAGATRIADLLATTTSDDLVIVLISGGASALLTLPAAHVALDDKIALTQILLDCGATINEINTVRKHVSRIKGGQLAALAAPARIATLILSDVIGSPLDVIGSGPTVPDPTTFAEAWAVIERYSIADQIPGAIRDHLIRGRDGALGETPKPDDPLFNRVQNVVIGSNPLAAEAAALAATEHGYHALILTTFLEGEARMAGSVLASIAREIAAYDRPIARPALLIAGGETTVTVRGDGTGGRNQEVALGAVRSLAAMPNVTLIALATDGGDGPTDAAGAVVTGATLDRARQLDLEPDSALRSNNAYNFFAPLNDLIRCGPTLTNVNDLTFVAIE